MIVLVHRWYGLNPASIDRSSEVLRPFAVEGVVASLVSLSEGSYVSPYSGTATSEFVGTTPVMKIFREGQPADF
jgi:hypothetical protein